MSPDTPTEADHRVVAITGGRFVPSRRFRVKALVPYLQTHGIHLDELCPRLSSYPPSTKIARPVWFISALVERLTYVLRANGYDAIILQRELISTLATIEGLLPGPRILDVDDAIFLHRDGRAARKIASGCLLVVCGNEYLAESFSQWTERIAIIPTGVDTQRLRPAESNGRDDELTIGWIGTVGNFQFLEQMKSALASVLKRHKKVIFRLISSERPDFLDDLGDQVDFVQWYPGIEESLIPTFSIGIMPLADNGWSRGKCAFKMLQYMAAGIPVVTSKVGVNAQLLNQDEIGIGVLKSDQWVEALEFLLSDPTSRHRMGANGRALAVAEYSLPKIAALWKQQFDRVL